MNAIEISDLTFSYSNSPAVLLNISVEIAVGEVVVIAGPSGSGKSTLCNIMCGVIPHCIKGSLGGNITVMGLDPRDAGLPKTSLKAGMVFQDADSQIICSTVEDELAFGLENLCLPPNEIRSRVDELIDDFGFSGSALANPSFLSGGQKKLLVIAAVLAPSPPILILDEPMSGLDSTGRDLVLTAIERQRMQGRTVVIVEHDLRHVSFADRWLLLKEGSVAQNAAPSEILQNGNLPAEFCLA